MTWPTIRAASAAALVASILVAATAAGAQQMCARAGAREPDLRIENAKYDGRFTFARIAYTQSMSGFGRGFSREPFWHHDYPDADLHFTKLISELSTVRGNTGRSVILSSDDPELMKFPVAYLVEPGHWEPSDREITGLRNYLKKGGFLIIDDMADRPYGNDVDHFTDVMTRVLPGMRLVELSADHPIFDAFYRVKSIEYEHPYYCLKSRFYGIFEDNDPKKRMMVIVNDNNDIGEYWEWSDQGFFAVNPSNEAYKLGINYVIYALTR